jgi:hypothetical protein
MTWKEFHIDDTDVSEWLPWGGLVRPEIMKEKDGSLFGVIEYQSAISIQNKKMRYRDYTNGWVIWSERQHIDKETKEYLVFLWNPFYDRGHRANNLLCAGEIRAATTVDYFAKEFASFAKDLSEILDCRILAYQEIIDFLAGSLSFGENKVKMPEVPLYLDMRLSEPVKIAFQDNGLTINQQPIIVFSLPGVPEQRNLQTLYKALSFTNYRYVQRLLLFGHAAAEKELDAYAEKWCSGRKSLRKILTADILSNLNGYSMAVFFIPVPSEQYDAIEKYCQDVLQALEIPYVMENYNLKDIWWASLPGIFRANITPPIIGFSSLEEFLAMPTLKIGGEAACAVCTDSTVSIGQKNI